MVDLSLLLDRWSRGDREAFEALIPLVYDELRRLADLYLRNERDGHTLQPTALVHEAYLRLSETNGQRIETRSHFFGAAAMAMRRVLVDHARKRRAAKREAPLVTSAEPAFETPFDVLALNDALDRLAAISPERARVVELRYFGGLSIEEAAKVLRTSPTTVKRHWTFARAWLLRALGPAA